MSVPAYPAYKDSGAAWLRDVPSGWEQRPARRLFAQRRDQALADDEQLSATQKYGVIPQRLFMEMQDQKVVLALSGIENFRHVERNDFVISLRSFQGGIEHTKYRGCVSPAYTVLRVSQSVVPGYWAYLFKSNPFISALQAVTEGIRDGKTVSYEQFASILLPLPKTDEQSAIAAFLDRETGKIDALVAEQERLIALLKEKRQAIISQAVTKGLDASVRMKDSGVAWLGQVPMHWGIQRIKHAVTHVVDCLHTTPTYDGDLAFPAIRTADVDRGRLLLDQALLVSAEVYSERIQRLRPRHDDILYSREGERFGMAALVPPDVELCLGQRMMMFRSSPRTTPPYLMWVLNSDAVYQQVRADVAGSTSPHVNISDIINFEIPAPPLEEQLAISTHIGCAVDELDTLTAEGHSVITLLRERRAALISAAVTGKIDVRGMVAAAQEAA